MKLYLTIIKNTYFKYCYIINVLYFPGNQLYNLIEQFPIVNTYEY